MQGAKPPNERLLEFLEHEKLTVYKFMQLTGISKPVAYSISNSRTEISIESLKLIAITFDQLDMRWLLTGQGEMLMNGVKKMKGFTITVKLDE